MRLFIAINFSQASKEKLVRIQQHIKKVALAGNFSRIENLHLTLAFLGEIDSRQLHIIKGAMDSITMPEFEINIKGIGSFSNRKGKIVWAGIEHSAKLYSLQKELALTLNNSGILLEDRPYKPHLTLGREVRFGEVKPTDFSPFSFTVSSIDLMLSEVASGVLTYKLLYKKELA